MANENAQICFSCQSKITTSNAAQPIDRSIMEQLKKEQEERTRLQERFILFERERQEDLDARQQVDTPN